MVSLFQEVGLEGVHCITKAIVQNDYRTGCVY